MKGIELSRRYFEEYGKAMLENEFADVMKYIAVGFVGSGSDRYGFDDEISQDHDFEPGFCIFLPDEDIVDRRTAFLLERAYAKLPNEFCGYKRQHLSPVGGNRNGVIRISDFYLSAVGSADGKLTYEQWLRLPDYALAEAVNGEVYFDSYGEFSAIRQKLLKMPEDIKLKRLAGNILIMAQAGQYNFVRCMKHNEPEAAQLAVVEFVNATMKTVFLLNNRYLPYYKWSFRAMRILDEAMTKKLSLLLFGDNFASYKEKSVIIEDISASIIFNLKQKNYCKSDSSDLEAVAYSVNNQIKDGTVRNLNIFYAV